MEFVPHEQIVDSFGRLSPFADDWRTGRIGRIRSFARVGRLRAPPVTQL
jgi:hypothetical protein